MSRKPTPQSELEDLSKLISTRSLTADLEDLGGIANVIAPTVRRNIEKLQSFISGNSRRSLGGSSRSLGGSSRSLGGSSRSLASNDGGNVVGLSDTLAKIDEDRIDSDDMSEELRNLNAAEDNLRDELELTGLWGEDLEYESFRKNFIRDDSWKIPKADLDKIAELFGTENFVHENGEHGETKYKFTMDLNNVNEEEAHENGDASEDSIDDEIPSEFLSAPSSDDYDIHYYKSDDSHPTIPLPQFTVANPIPAVLKPYLTKCHREFLEFPTTISETLIGFNSSPNEKESCVRMCYVKIRPDVLCGAVMDAVSKVVDRNGGELTKRQGSHLKADFGNVYSMDAQLCIKKNMERVLVVSIHKLNGRKVNVKGIKGDFLKDAIMYLLGEKKAKEENMSLRRDGMMKRNSLQQIMASQMKVFTSVRGMNVTQQEDEEEMKHLCMRKENEQVVKLGFALILDVIDELEIGYLAFCTLATSPFGSLPALPTIDVHYISEIRHLSRELMVLTMLQSASELESFAREAEMNAISVVKLLARKFHEYGVKLPQFPRLLSLNDYPLHFDAPEGLSPPWGQIVNSAVEQISSQLPPATAPINENVNNPPTIIGFEQADDACIKVFNAFQEQDSLEQNARLDRKNLQVMDRLAKSETWTRDCLIAVKEAYHDNMTARKRGDDVYRQLASISPTFKKTVPPNQCVPLLATGVTILSPINSRGLCTITFNHILIQANIGIQIWKPPRTFLLGISYMIKLTEDIVTLSKGDEDLLSFKPDITAKKWKQFAELVKDSNEEAKKNESTVTAKRGCMKDCEDDTESDSNKSLG